MDHLLEFFENISADSLKQHWQAYRTSSQSPLIGDTSNADGKKEFLERLGFVLSAEVSSAEMLHFQTNLGMALREASESLLDSRSDVLLEFDVVEEILCLRYISSNWAPIFSDETVVPIDVSQIQFKEYADRRKFLCIFLRGLQTVFGEHVESTDLKFEEALWLRDYLQKSYNCLVLEVFAPEVVQFEQRLFSKRPQSFSSSIFAYRFVRNIEARVEAVTQRTPWIDSTLTSIVSGTLAYTRTIREEVAAADILQATDNSVSSEFRFFNDAASRYSGTNGLQVDIDLRYFGKSFERAFDRPLISIIEYLIEAGAVFDDTLSRSKMYTLYELLTSYIKSATVMAPEDASRELYFPPPELPKNLGSHAAPRVSIIPELSKINPERDVREITELLEAIE